MRNYMREQVDMKHLAMNLNWCVRASRMGTASCMGEAARGVGVTLAGGTALGEGDARGGGTA
jgi:hypothetical protein